MNRVIGIMLPVFLLSAAAIAQELKPIQLPPPDTAGGKPLMQALQNRHSTREYSSDTLSLPILSNLLWAAWGVNRPESGKRTAPSAMDKREIDLYLATAHGLCLYDPDRHLLRPVATGDIREKTGAQDFVKVVPLNIIYVADYARTSGSDSSKFAYSFADAAFVAENVYLFCASEGLGAVVRGSIDRDSLAPAMKLRRGQHIILAQSVGYPKK
jgi:nitroreductase